MSEIKPPSNMELIFVYGSLKNGEYNNYRLGKKAEFIREVRTAPEYTLFNLGPYPALAHHGTTQIQGELWRVSRKTFNELAVMEKNAGYALETVNLSKRTTNTPIWCWTMNSATNRLFQDCGTFWSTSRGRLLSLLPSVQRATETHRGLYDPPQALSRSGQAPSHLKAKKSKSSKK